MTFAATIATELSLESDFEMSESGFTMEAAIERDYAEMLEDTASLESMADTASTYTAHSVLLNTMAEQMPATMSVESARVYSDAATAILGGETAVIAGGGAEQIINLNPVSRYTLESDDENAEESTEETKKGFAARAKEMAGAAWDRIKQHASKLASAIASVVTSMGRLKSAISKAKSQVEGMDDKGNEMTVDAKLAAVILTPSTEGGKNIADGMKVAHSATKEFVGNFVDAAGDYYSAIANDINSAKKADSDSAAEAEAKSITDKFSNVGAKVKGIFTRAVKETTSSKPLPGNYLLSYTSENGVGRLKLSRSGDYAPGEKKFAAPSKADLADMLSEAEAIVSTIESKKSKIEQMTNKRKEATDAAAELLAASEKGKISKLWASSKNSVILRATNASLTQSLGSYVTYLFKIAKAAVTFAQKAVKANGGSSAKSTSDSDNNAEGATA